MSLNFHSDLPIGGDVRFLFVSIFIGSFIACSSILKPVHRSAYEFRTIEDRKCLRECLLIYHTCMTWVQGAWGVNWCNQEYNRCNEETCGLQPAPEPSPSRLRDPSLPTPSHLNYQGEKDFCYHFPQERKAECFYRTLEQCQFEVRAHGNRGECVQKP